MPRKAASIRFPGKGKTIAASRNFTSVAEKIFFLKELDNDPKCFLALSTVDIEKELDRRWATLKTWERNAYDAMAREYHSDERILKHAPMARCVQDGIDTHPGHFSNGVGWHKVPRQTRHSPHQPVTRKTEGSVIAFSTDADALLHGVFAAGDLATNHRKRKTITHTDVDLVRKIQGI